MVSFLSLWQGPVQAKLRPAMWIPGVNLVHSHREKWSCPGSQPAACVEELIRTVERVQAQKETNGTYVVSKVNRETFKVQILNWTFAEWLDVVEIEFKPAYQKQGSEAKCLSFSSGILPTWFPLCFIFNSVFCMVPFWDRHFNRNRLRNLRSEMHIQCKLTGQKGDQRDPLI